MSKFQDQLVGYARECLGTPFKHQGRIVGLALDCVGVAAHVMTRAGLDYTDAKGYTRTPCKGLLEATLDNQPHIYRVDKAQPLQPGDFILFRIRRDPQHVAVYTGHSIIHGYFSSARVVEQTINAGWQRRITAVYRVSKKAVTA
jgi:cell wall-associated NlpC family hydrolase